MNFCPKNTPGLYDPKFEKDSCGIGFVANIRGVPSRQIVDDASNMLCSMEHRGAPSSIGAKSPVSGPGAYFLTE